MNQEREGWRVILGLVVILVLVGGPNLTLIGVLFPPLLKEFHWNHEQVSRIASAAAFTLGLMGPAVGWMIDRVPPRWMMAVGLAIVGVCDLAISTVHTLTAMTLLFALVGLGAALSGLIPMMVVAISWFKERRGVATGVVIAGLSVGMTLSPPLVTWVIDHWGWRVVMRLLALPIFFIVIPSVLALVRMKPVEAGGERLKRRKEEAEAMPGLEVAASIATTTFWLLFLGQLLYQVGFAAVYVHQITFLVGVGYTPEIAALIFSSQTAASGLGAVLMGALADRLGPRVMLAAAMISHALGVASLLGTASPHLTWLWITAFAIFWGAASGAGNLMPMLLSETLGVRRLGILMGVIGLCAAIAGAFAPIMSGAIFDATGSYSRAFELAIALMTVGGLLVTMVRPVKGHDVVPAAAAQSEVIVG